jgi:hypothetical protein
MFDQYQDAPREKRDKWFYASVIYAAFTVVSAASLTLYFSGVTSISDLFFRGMKVEGEISIVTKEQANVKLGAVSVCLVGGEKIVEWINAKNESAMIESKKAQTKLAYARYAKLWADQDYNEAASSSERLKTAALQADKLSKFNKAESELRYWSSPAFYLNGLKECESKVTTDADGKFSLAVRKGKYALAAQAERGAADSREEYFWLIWVTPETSGKPLLLGNDNLMNANPPEKVVEIRNFN